jgi:hypothetical protein
MNRTAIPSALYALIALAAAIVPSVASATIIIPAPKDSTKFQASTGVVSSVNIANDGGPLGSRVYFGTLNINNNDLIVMPSPATEAAALSAFANTTDMVRSGYDRGDWAGTGITSSIAAADAAGNGVTTLGFPGSGITAVGVILNDDGTHINPDGSGHPIWSTWDGFAVNQYSVLVKYTFYGDTKLKGYVNSADVGVVAANFGTGTNWAHGEFNYNGGPVNSTDVTQVNRSLALESTYGAVPEPTTFALATCAIFAMATIGGRWRPGIGAAR